MSTGVDVHEDFIACIQSELSQPNHRIPSLVLVCVCHLDERAELLQCGAHDLGAVRNGPFALAVVGGRVGRTLTVALDCGEVYFCCRQLPFAAARIEYGRYPLAECLKTTR